MSLFLFFFVFSVSFLFRVCDLYYVLFDEFCEYFEVVGEFFDQ